MTEFWNEFGYRQIRRHISTPLVSTANDFISSSLNHGASFWKQFFLAHQRSLKSQHAQIGSFGIELFIATLAGSIIGLVGSIEYQGRLIFPYSIISPVPNESAVPRAAVSLCVGISSTAAFCGVKTFGGREQLNRWREARSGHRQFSYYLGVLTGQLIRIFFSSFHFAFAFHLVSASFISFSDILSITILLYFAWYGFSTCIVSLAENSNAGLVSVIFAAIFSTFNGIFSQIPLFLRYISPCFWASEGYFTRQTAPFTEIMQVKSFSAPLFDYQYGRFEFDCLIILLIGIIYHILGYFLMIRRNQKH